jgi:hypothetical protein
MGRVVNVMQLAFWASVPLFGAYLAASWELRWCSPWWVGFLLESVVVASSAYLTVRFFHQLFPHPAEEARDGSSRRTSEVVVYPAACCLALLPWGLQTMPC